MINCMTSKGDTTLYIEGENTEILADLSVIIDDVIEQVAENMNQPKQKLLAIVFETVLFA